VGKVPPGAGHGAIGLGSRGRARLERPVHLDPYRTIAPDRLVARESTPRDLTWLPLAIVLSLPMTLVLFCAMVRSSIYAELIPSTVLQGAVAYAALVIVVCGRDLLRR